MRVNLSYSVELEEVLPSLEKLYRQGRQEFEKDYNSTIRSFERGFADDKIEYNIQTLERCRNLLTTFEIRLGEFQRILIGYKKVLDGEMGTDAPDYEAPPKVEELKEAWAAHVENEAKAADLSETNDEVVDD
jgi:hypothetical protein